MLFLAGGKQLFTFRFPRFETEAYYDPIFGWNSDVDGSSSNGVNGDGNNDGNDDSTDDNDDGEDCCGDFFLPKAKMIIEGNFLRGSN